MPGFESYAGIGMPGTGLDFVGVASEDLTAWQYKLVCLVEDTYEVRAATETDVEAVFGVLQNAPNLGDAAFVRYLGLTSVVAGEIVAKDAILMAGVIAADAGKAMKGSSAGTGLRLGRSLSAGAADGVIFMFLCPYGVE